MNKNPYTDKDLLINNLSKEEQFELKNSLLGQTLRIITYPKYGLFTEHGFPVAKFHFSKDELDDFPSEFYGKVIQTEPIITVDNGK